MLHHTVFEIYVDVKIVNFQICKLPYFAIFYECLDEHLMECYSCAQHDTKKFLYSHYFWLFYYYYNYPRKPGGVRVKKVLT